MIIKNIIAIIFILLIFQNSAHSNFVYIDEKYNGIENLKYNSNKHILATISTVGGIEGFSRNISLFDLKSKKIISNYKSQVLISDFDFTEKGDYLVFIENKFHRILPSYNKVNKVSENTINIFNIKNNNVERKFLLKIPNESESINSVTIDPFKKDKLLILSNLGKIIYFDLKSGIYDYIRINETQKNEMFFHKVLCNKNSKTIYAIDKNQKKVYLIDFFNKRVLKTITFKEPIYSIKTTNNGENIIIYSNKIENHDRNLFYLSDFKNTILIQYSFNNIYDFLSGTKEIIFFYADKNQKNLLYKFNIRNKKMSHFLNKFSNKKFEFAKFSENGEKLFIVDNNNINVLNLKNNTIECTLNKK